MKGFLSGNQELDPAVLKEGTEAERFLSYNDDNGIVSENDALYTAKRSMSISDDSIERMRKGDTQLYETYRNIGGQADFMRAGHGDMSHTVPLAIKKEMIAAQIEQLKKFEQLYLQIVSRKDKTQDPGN